MKVLFSIFVLTVFGHIVFAQSSYEDKCHVYIVDVEKATKAEDNFVKTEDKIADEKALGITTLAEFGTDIGEENLTTKHFPFPNSKLTITASVFYTDGSLSSYPQDDYEDSSESMLIGIMVSNKAQESALSASTLNAAVTEVTYDKFTNIVRTQQYIKVGGRKFLLGLQCDCMAKRKAKSDK